MPPPANSLFGRAGTGPRAGQPQGNDLAGGVREPGRTIGDAATPASTYFPTTKFPGLIGTVSGTPPKAPTPVGVVSGSLHGAVPNVPAALRGCR